MSLELESSVYVLCVFRSFWTESEILQVARSFHGRVPQTIASSMLLCPSVQHAPVPTPAYLRGLLLQGKGRTVWCIVGVADNIIPQLSETVCQMCYVVCLIEASMGFHDRRAKQFL